MLARLVTTLYLIVAYNVAYVLYMGVKASMVDSVQYIGRCFRNSFVSNINILCHNTRNGNDNEKLQLPLQKCSLQMLLMLLVSLLLLKAKSDQPYKHAYQQKLQYVPVCTSKWTCFMKLLHRADRKMDR